MSRLDKIFILLETGSNPQTRKLAATQIGEVSNVKSYLYKQIIYIYVCSRCFER